MLAANSTDPPAKAIPQRRTAWWSLWLVVITHELSSGRARKVVPLGRAFNSSDAPEPSLVTAPACLPGQAVYTKANG